MTLQIYFDEKEVFTGLIIEILVECILLIYDEYFVIGVYMVKVYCNYWFFMIFLSFLININ